MEPSSRPFASEDTFVGKGDVKIFSDPGGPAARHGASW